MVDPDRDPQAGADRPAGSASPELTLSAERLRTDTVRVPFQTARLEKYLVTESETVTVQVTREEVRVVHSPLDHGADAVESATAGVGADGAADRWLTISEERAEVVTRIVPIARVRLETFWVDGETEVTESVRREELDTDLGAADSGGPGGRGEREAR